MCRQLLKVVFRGTPAKGFLGSDLMLGRNSVPGGPRGGERTYLLLYPIRLGASVAEPHRTDIAQVR